MGVGTTSHHDPNHDPNHDPSIGGGGRILDRRRRFQDLHYTVCLWVPSGYAEAGFDHALPLPVHKRRLRLGLRPAVRPPRMLCAQSAVCLTATPLPPNDQPATLLNRPKRPQPVVPSRNPVRSPNQNRRLQDRHFLGRQNPHRPRIFRWQAQKISAKHHSPPIRPSRCRCPRNRTVRPKSTASRPNSAPSSAERGAKR